MCGSAWSLLRPHGIDQERRFGVRRLHKENTMATFITLANFTAQGIAAIKDGPARLDAAREQLAAIGVTIKDFYLTMGEYDLVTVIDAPDNITAAKALLAIGVQGNISTTSMAALTENEYRALIADMP
jgi:uncharacterized protein with GYD domain